MGAADAAANVALMLAFFTSAAALLDIARAAIARLAAPSATCCDIVADSGELRQGEARPGDSKRLEGGIFIRAKCPAAPLRGVISDEVVACAATGATESAANAAGIAAPGAALLIAPRRLAICRRIVASSFLRNAFFVSFFFFFDVERPDDAPSSSSSSPLDSSSLESSSLDSSSLSSSAPARRTVLRTPDCVAPRPLEAPLPAAAAFAAASSTASGALLNIANATSCITLRTSRTIRILNSAPYSSETN